MVKLNGLGNEFFILGGGSNVSFVEDYDGQIIRFEGKRVSVTEKEEDWFVEAEAGVNWHSLVQYLINQDIPGLENLALIPGNCGAAPVQNIGAYGSEFSDYCYQVHTTDLISRKYHVFDAIDCNFGYRNSLFKESANKALLITKVVLKLPKLWRPKLSYHGLNGLPVDATPKTVMEKVIQIRNNKLPDPKSLANSGSFFKNPVIDEEEVKRLRQTYSDIPCYSVDGTKVKLSAGWLIEKAGFKGARVGDVGTYINHALVVVNYNKATGADLLNFVRSIRDKVQLMFGVTLENEVLLMGRDGLITL